MRYFADIDKVRDKIAAIIEEYKEKGLAEDDPHLRRDYLDVLTALYLALSAVTKLITDPETLEVI